MRIVELREEAELLNLAADWEKLLEESASDTIFLTWEWISAWWRTYGEPGALRILLAIDQDGRLRGIAPMRRQTARRYGRTFQTLAFIGDGSNDSDYLDFIVGAGYEAAVIDAFLEYWDRNLSQGTLLQLNEIPESSPNFALLRSYGERAGVVSREQDVECGTVSLPCNWQDYLKTLSARFRTKIRSVLRNVESRSDVSFRFCDDPVQLSRLLPSLYDLHGRRWAKEAKSGVFQWGKKRVFYETLSPLLLGRSWLSFSWFEWKGQILACQYGFTYRKRYFQLQEGYDPTCEHWNLGIALRAWSIQQFLSKGVREYDFLAGMGRHKSDWGATTKVSKRLVLGYARPDNVLFCKGPEWVSDARQLVKKCVPQRLIAAHDTYQERRRVHAFARPQAPPNGSGEPWIRSALATCYFHSPLPAILPSVRERYSLRISQNGTGPKVSWRKRQEPSARILYYHRVNDDRDPFFPATPTKMFEEQIRFVAKHYPVVSLAEIVKRLSEGRPAGPVVAITFDDGYQDNYLNAFPILQRYGLTATIFLTTGSIDSREPLWFEKVALAIKNTSQKFIDVETTLPRRLWLRTGAERLQAKDEIYAFVRNLADAERKRWLSEILAQLGDRDNRQRNDKMLTWDQIRLMGKKGIDFGGHTVTHPFSSRLLPEQLRWEISECKTRIEHELQTSVKHFAYPSGREQDFSEWNKKVIHDAGYEAAVSTLWGVNYPATDPMELRRGQPWEEKTSPVCSKT